MKIKSRYIKKRIGPGRRTADEQRVITGIVDAGPDIIAHHKNGDKQDNRPENLQVMSRYEHLKLHGFWTTIRHSPDTIFGPDENNMAVCRHCGDKKTWDRFVRCQHVPSNRLAICYECFNQQRKERKLRKGR